MLNVLFPIEMSVKLPLTTNTVAKIHESHSLKIDQNNTIIYFETEHNILVWKILQWAVFVTVLVPVFDHLPLSTCNRVLKDPSSFSNRWVHLCSLIHTICIKYFSYAGKHHYFPWQEFYCKAIFQITSKGNLLCNSGNRFSIFTHKHNKVSVT